MLMNLESNFRGYLVDIFMLFIGPRAVLKTKGTVFSHTDRPSPVNNMFIFFLQ